MKGRIVDFARLINRKQRLTVELDGDFSEVYDALNGMDVDVNVTRWRDKRSLDANAYAWVLINKIAAALSVRKEEVYRRAIREIGGVSEVVCVQDRAVEKLCEGWRRNGIGWQTDTEPSRIEGCTRVTLYYGSSTYDTKQMSCLIDELVEEAKELGIETMTPEQLAELFKNERR